MQKYIQSSALLSLAFLTACGEGENAELNEGQLEDDQNNIEAMADEENAGEEGQLSYFDELRNRTYDTPESYLDEEKYRSIEETLRNLNLPEKGKSIEGDLIVYENGFEFERETKVATHGHLPSPEFHQRDPEIPEASQAVGLMMKRASISYDSFNTPSGEFGLPLNGGTDYYGEYITEPMGTFETEQIEEEGRPTEIIHYGWDAIQNTSININRELYELEQHYKSEEYQLIHEWSYETRHLLYRAVTNNAEQYETGFEYYELAVENIERMNEIIESL
ncbi:hypothetical protein [Alkalicoccus luteus]|uniref:Uncharacterized protein n=1 Tax=Alkalicoccus luteus TaxID=1237094 RepID=A0A969PPF4_9BACI|nr:hypothetical protein [Alkalicoccus luteus]NJP36001.1 hypothetical protein [Alkalicoccus luteus]